MNRRQFLQASVAAAAASNSNTDAKQGETAAINSEHIDFGYAFAPPHRMSVARPEASEKTLLDLEPGRLTVSWSYDDLRHTPLAILKPPQTHWRIRIEPQWDGKPFSQSTWKRARSCLPVLSNVYSSATARLQLEVAGSADAALLRISAENRDALPHQLRLSCEVVDGWVAHNPGWMETRGTSQCLVACQGDRPDRLLIFGIGADRFPVSRMGWNLEWTIPAGETRHGWIVRPHKAYREELSALTTRDWGKDFEAAVEEWENLLNRAVKINVPDEGVRNGFYSCLGDLFVMREPLAEGYVGTSVSVFKFESWNSDVHVV